MSFPKTRSFDLREKKQSALNKKGRKKAEFEIIPNSISPLVADWSAEVKNRYRKKLISNVPIEYISFLSHADSDSIKILKARDLITDQEISFKPAYFESDEKNQFNLLDLFSVQMTPENRVTTIFRAFSNSWCSQITSLPWRHNEIMALMTIYPFIEEQFYSPNAQKITLADLVRECSKKQRKKDYIRTLYSLLVLQDTDLLLVDSEKKILSASKKLFYIKSAMENVQSLEEELKDLSNREIKILSLLEKFEIHFSAGALFEIEKLHVHKTAETPQGWVNLRNGTRPSWKPKIFKGGHLFHVPHPNLNIGNHIIRSWMLLSAYQPQGRSQFQDLMKSFNFEAFVAILGLVNVQQHKPEIFKKYLSQISEYWGAFEVKDKTINIKYGFHKKIQKDLLENPDGMDTIDLNYGFLSNSAEDVQQTVRSIPFSQLTEIFITKGLDEVTAKLCARKTLVCEKQEKFTGSEINMHNFNANIEPPKRGEATPSRCQRGGNRPPVNCQKGVNKTKITSQRGELNYQRGGNALSESFIDGNKSSLETVRETENRDYSSLSRNRVEFQANEAKKPNHDLSYNVLLTKIDALQEKKFPGYEGSVIRAKFLHALEKGVNPSFVSRELEKIENIFGFGRSKLKGMRNGIWNT